MITKRDDRIIVMLSVQAALSAGSGSALIAELFPRIVVAALGWLVTMISAGTAMYVGLTRELEMSPGRGTPAG
jgi:hypothetical protein